MTLPLVILNISVDILSLLIINSLLIIKDVLSRIPCSGLSVNNVDRLKYPKCTEIVDLILERHWGIPQSQNIINSNNSKYILICMGMPKLNIIQASIILINL